MSMGPPFEVEAAQTTTPLADGHTHLDQYEPEEISGILERAKTAGVGLIIVAGTTMASCQHILELCDSYPTLYAGVGLHPMDLPGRVDEATWAALRGLARHPKVVVWSETGLDYLPTSPDRTIQDEAFRRQIQLAREVDLPLVVHSREANEDTLRLLQEEDAGAVGGAWHYFQGDLGTAQSVMELGFYISLAKPLLRLPGLQEVAAQLPLDRIVLETDSFPQPFKKYRHRWTEPYQLPQVAAKLAELQSTTLDRVAQVTTGNLLRMLKGRVSMEQMAGRSPGPV